jgi:hypothetical protein
MIRNVTSRQKLKPWQIHFCFLREAFRERLGYRIADHILVLGSRNSCNRAVSITVSEVNRAQRPAG